MKVKQILSRIYVNDIDQAISFYEELLQDKCASRFLYPQMNLEIARISNLLFVGGTDEALAPFRSTSITMLVDSVEGYKDFLLKNGATIIRDVLQVPTGLNMTVRHADGTVVEYVEHQNIV